jgi:hypothetical protein
MMNKPYNGTTVQQDADGDACCPLCGKKDSGSHTMGECTNREMHKLYVARHNRAVEIILLALRKSSWFTNSAMLMDAGRAGELPDGVIGKGDLIQELYNHAPRDGPLDGDVLTKPDIVVVQGRTPAAACGILGSADRFSPNQKLVFFEVGYCSDTRFSQKLDEKREQHRMTARRLENQGYVVEYESFNCIALGHGASVFHNVRYTLEHYQVPTTVVDHAMRKLVQNAAQYALAIMTERRAQEAIARENPGERSEIHYKRHRQGG